MVGQQWSDGLQRLAVWLSGVLGAYGDVEQVLAQVGQLTMSDTTAWRQVQTTGRQFRAQEARRVAAANAAPDRHTILPGEPPSQERLAAVMDGAMIHIRAEGWKELKVGGIGHIECSTRQDRATGDEVEWAQMTTNTYVAHLGGPQAFGQQLWAEAQARGWSRAADTAVIGDGAPWIWNLASEHFYDSQQIVDWYHAKQHLWQAAHLLHGEGTPAAQQWVQTFETVLFEGHAERVAAVLLTQAQHKRKSAAELRQQAGYFRDNQRRMQYQERREDNYPIGSGTAESGCKQFRARFTAAGMRWSRTGAENLLPVRAAILSQRFDTLWQARQLPLN